MSLSFSPVSDKNLIETFINLYKETEAPTIYYRWAMLSGIAATLGRNCWIQHGPWKRYPNQYIMLVGESAARKDTPIKEVRKLLQLSGYKTFSSNKTSKEKFLLDLQDGMNLEDLTGQSEEARFNVHKGAKKNQTLKELFGPAVSTNPSECYISIGEFNTFLGHGNIEFIDLLTDLWDFEGIFTNRIKNGVSVLIPDPTINILGGNTNVGISMSFPTEVIGQGFFSRLIMVYSDPTGRRITLPPPPDKLVYGKLVDKLIKLREMYRGEVTVTIQSWKALDEVYQNWKELEDTRFRSYSGRRLGHLIKLCMLVAASRESRVVEVDDVIYANTILHYTEYLMPKALGEFGKARNSDISMKVLEIIDKADRPLDVIKDIWTRVSRDLENRKQLGELIHNLAAAGKIQVVNGKILPLKKAPNFNFPFCNIQLLPEWKDDQLNRGIIL